MFRHRTKEAIHYADIDLNGVLEGVVTSEDNVWLNNGNNALALANQRIACLVPHVALDGQLRRLASSDVDVQRRAPFGEDATRCFVLLEALGQRIKPLHHRLPVATW